MNLPSAPVDIERRSRHRYPIALDVIYKATLTHTPIVHRGRTLNISSNGVLFQSEQAVTVGSQIVLIIRWPILLLDVCPLNLVMIGQVVRIEERGAVAVQVHTYEFRTAGKSLVTAA